ncbi:DUF4255 domain-containing protein [Urechidicola croceus]|uniref:Pvc16 N-terminal domain-containing protein n=1 Tax=Urechidicola croceus TaxID=1850246 RepID=A0A1D8P823_9FLAO|nr:DUF4255 domain-containing protein [Urechidicola croceus]AOW20715.1 hypothetical protein LPB138_08510 [Urechidicola croceus]
MIHAALTHIRDILNQSFKNQFSISENKVVLSNIIKSDGSVDPNIESKIVFFLVSIEEESTLKNSLSRSVSKNSGSFAYKSPSLHLNMHLLFCANFDGAVYPEGLKYLSFLIRFFQSNRKISIRNSDSNLKELSLEISKLEFSQLSHLWSALGSKLMPSVLYKVRTIVFDDETIEKITPSIKGIDNQT